MLLEPLHAFRRADVDGLLDLEPDHFLARLVERQHRVVVHLKLPPVNLGLKHLRPRNHVVPENDLLRRPPQLQDRQQLPAWHNVPVNRVVHPRPKHLPDVAPRGPPRLTRSEEHTSELQSQSNLVCRLLLEKKKKKKKDIKTWT